MHSSRMRTTRLLPVSPRMHCSWGGGGLSAPGGGVSALGGVVCSRGNLLPGMSVSSCTEADPPPPVNCYIWVSLGFLEIVPEEQRTVGSVMLQFILNRYVQVHEQQIQ